MIVKQTLSQIFNKMQKKFKIFVFIILLLVCFFFFFILPPSSRKNKYSHRLSLIRSRKVCATIENTGRSELRLVLRLRINQSPSDSLSWRFCCEFLPRLEPRKRSSKIPIDNESREAGLASCVDLKIWLSDPNNPRVLSTEILL